MGCARSAPPSRDSESACFRPATGEDLKKAVERWIDGRWGGSHISNWDTSSVTDMAGLFKGAVSFDDDLSAWNVSAVTSMRSMFNGAKNFNSNLRKWDVRKVTQMSFMFAGATSFNCDLSSWNVSNVVDMKFLFHKASSFNSDLSTWDVSHVSDMESMFQGASSFHGDLSEWDVRNVLNMRNMFLGATAFNETAASYGGNPRNSMMNIKARAKEAWFQRTLSQDYLQRTVSEEVRISEEVESYDYDILFLFKDEGSGKKTKEDPIQDSLPNGNGDLEWI